MNLEPSGFFFIKEPSHFLHMPCRFLFPGSLTRCKVDILLQAGQRVRSPCPPQASQIPLSAFPVPLQREHFSGAYSVSI